MEAEGLEDGRLSDRIASLRQDLKYLGILVLLWSMAAGIDQLWLALDHAIPSWDPADHLIGALNYWWTLNPQRLFQEGMAGGGFGDLWTALWTLSSKYPPLVYISTAPFLGFFGRGADQATLVNLLYTGILLLSVYGLGRILFRPEVGLWAGALCLLFPQFYSLRTGYFMDYPLTAMVTASVFMLTVWRQSAWRQSIGRQSKDWSDNKVPGGGWEKDVKPCPSKPLADGHPFVLSILPRTDILSFGRSLTQWGLAIAFGLTFGLALLTKQTAVFFLAAPILWVFLERLLALRYRDWNSLGQLATSLIIAGLMILPWSQANWIFQISAAFNSNSRSAEIEGDPAWNTLAGWTHYWQQLPQAISYPLLIVPIVGLLFASFRAVSSILTPQSLNNSPASEAFTASTKYPNFRASFLWLGLCLLSTYVIWSAIANKDSRYIMPWLPLWSIVLAYGLLSFPKRWGLVKWITLGFAGVLMMMNLFPLGGDLGRSLTRALAPGAYHQPYLGETWPHDQVVQEIIEAQPYQIANVGVLPSTPDINQHSFTYIGNRHDFQVYARRMGKDKDSLERDVRSLPWFLSVTAPNVNHHSGKSRRRQQEVVDLIRDSGAFKRQQQWTVPDGSRLTLFRRRQLPVKVKPIKGAIASVYEDSPIKDAVLSLLSPSGGIVPDIQPLAVQLDDVTVPDRVPPGQPVPVTYKWSGSWSKLHDGLVFLTWQRTRNGSDASNPDDALQQSLKSDAYWTHDHNIGLGTLYPQIIQANQTAIAPVPDINPLKPFTVIERTAMLPPATVKPGTYALTATYLNPTTGETYPLEVPSVSLKVRPNAKSTLEQEDLPPELDYVTQLRQAALDMPKGVDGLDQVFDQLSRVNLYDPIQIYTTHAEQILSHRLQQNPSNLDDTYGLALAHVLQRDADGAIAALENATVLDPDNPFAHAELAFVNLYGWRPWAAQKALDRAIELAPDVPELRILNVATALMRGNVWQAWRRYQVLP